MITIKQTRYWGDHLDFYNDESKLKALIQKIKENTTIDLGGLFFGALSFVAFLWSMF